jgi:2-polyprenyl-3-methyl-5-hydroxy-6-metoxy-1,4-benzoquinol methylase
MSGPPLDTRNYWTTRLRRGGISAVGRLGVSDQLNRTLYDLAQRNVRRLCDQYALFPVSTTLDVGTGWGFWVDFWHAAGVGRVDAIDFAEQSIDDVRARWPRSGVYRVVDLADDKAFSELGTYPLVSCMNVLLHILDDSAFERALANVARVVAPGGHLLLAEPARIARVQLAPGRSGRSRSRPLAAYAAPGLTLLDVQPAAAIAGDPIDAPNRLAMLTVRAWWLAVLAGDRFLPPLRRLMSSSVAGADELARRAGWATTGKLLLFHRPGQQGGSSGWAIPWPRPRLDDAV